VKSWDPAGLAIGPLHRVPFTFLDNLHSCNLPKYGGAASCCIIIRRLFWRFSKWSCNSFCIKCLSEAAVKILSRRCGTLFLTTRLPKICAETYFTLPHVNCPGDIIAKKLTVIREQKVIHNLCLPYQLLLDLLVKVVALLGCGKGTDHHCAKFPLLVIVGDQFPLRWAVPRTSPFLSHSSRTSLFQKHVLMWKALLVFRYSSLAIYITKSIKEIHYHHNHHV
jgi:hypothetical protein